jgi:hypothetical protein
MPRSVDDVKLRMDRVLLGVPPGLEASGESGLRGSAGDGGYEESLVAAPSSKGRRGTGLYIWGISMPSKDTTRR